MNRTSATHPSQALLLGHLSHRSASPTLQTLVREVRAGLDHQPRDTQVQVRADLCAQLMTEHSPDCLTEGLLLDLMIERQPDLSRHTRCNVMLGQLQMALEDHEALSWVDAAPALAALPGESQGWTLSHWHLLDGLCELRQRQRLPPDQARAVIDRLAALLRHLLAIAPVKAGVHPLTTVARHTGDAAHEAFAGLTAAEQAALLRTQPHAAACGFIAHLAQRGQATPTPQRTGLQALLDALTPGPDDALRAVVHSWLNLL